MNSYQQALLISLNRGAKHIYGGTVPAAVVAKRRAKDKAARVARRVQRRNAK